MHPGRLKPEDLGSEAFRKDYGVKYAYAAGGMYRAIASIQMVIRMARAGFLSFFGTGGLSALEIEAALKCLSDELRGLPFGMNLLPGSKEEDQIDLFLKYNVRCIEAGAYIQVTRALVRYRLTGIAEIPEGGIHIPGKIMAKVSRPEVAERFLSPPPSKLVEALGEAGLITEAEADLAPRIPMCDDLCVESDSGGHTDGGVCAVLLPTPGQTERRNDEKAWVQGSRPGRGGRRHRHA